MSVYKRWLRPLLFRLDAEKAQNLAVTVLQYPWIGRLLAGTDSFTGDPRLRLELNGLQLSSPVGLGAGFDKNCDTVDSLQFFGFGYLVLGSVLYHPRPGNPRPRVLRVPEREALLNGLGLPSKGLEHAVRRLKGRRPGPSPVIVDCNGFSLEEYIKCFEALQPLADGLEISLRCPNAVDDPGDFLKPQRFEELLTEISRRKRKPVFLKIPNYTTDRERQERLDLVERAFRYPVDGFTVSASLKVKEDRLSIGRGSLAGRPAFQENLRLVRDLYAVTKGRRHIKALGGIFSAEDAFEAIAAGASTAEIVTSFVYEGWNVARNISRGLIALLDRHGIENVVALRGAKAEGRGDGTGTCHAHPEPGNPQDARPRLDRLPRMALAIRPDAVGVEDISVITDMGAVSISRPESG